MPDMIIWQKYSLSNLALLYKSHILPLKSLFWSVCFGRMVEQRTVESISCLDKQHIHKITTSADFGSMPLKSPAGTQLPKVMGKQPREFRVLYEFGHWRAPILF